MWQIIPVACIFYFAFSKRLEKMSKKKKKNNRTVRATPVNNGPKKEKKPLSPEAKDRIKTSFLTLVNNDACIKAGREFRGLGFVFLAVGFALTGVVTSAVPNLVTRLNVNYGSGLLNTPTFSYDQGLVNFSKALSEKGCTILINDEGKLEITTATYNAETTTEEARAKQNVQAWADFLDSAEDYPWYCDQSTSVGAPIFNVFVKEHYKADGTGDYKEFSDAAFVKSITKGNNPNFVDQYSSDIEGINALAFGDSHIYFIRYKANGALSYSAPAGSYSALKGTDFKDIYDSATGEGGAHLTGDELKTAVVKKYKSIINRSTDQTRISTAWAYTGIAAGIFAGVELLFGLILFLLTRGKRNPYRIFTIWDCWKIAFYAALAPGILALGVGFLLPQFALFAFVFLYGIRIMWLSMKSLSTQVPAK